MSIDDNNKPGPMTPQTPLMSETPKEADGPEVGVPPAGYFSVRQELMRSGVPMSDKELSAIEAAWEKHWNKNKLETKFGPRRTHPRDFPKAQKGTQKP